MSSKQSDPWRAAPSYDNYWAVWRAYKSGPGATVAIDIRDEEEARLLAAAPDLLDALGELLHLAPMHSHTCDVAAKFQSTKAECRTCRAVDTARRAIAKATGETV